MALQSALELGAVPLLHGDIVVDEDGGWGIVSTEEIFIYLAPRLNPQHLILVGEVAGVFTDDPLKNPDVHLIPEITLKNIADVESMLSGSHGIDVTGGMSSKVMSLFALTQQLPHLQITFISGNQPKALEQILLGKRLNESTVMRFK
jgi:isopentenyl phosphate kinase